MTAFRSLSRRRLRRSLWGVAAMLLVGSCSAPEAPRLIPTAPPAPRLVAAPLPRSAPSSDWRDTPAAPGAWRWSDAGGGSLARFGEAGAAPSAELRCSGASRIVSLRIADGVARGAAAVPVTISTTTLSRAAYATTAGPGVLILALPASDPLLDAMAFSRGRFQLVAQGGAPIALPAWPEVARVIEDCRGTSAAYRP